MSRRRNTNSSSLDLFLDTICNAFGGIMFIAILLSIISQFRSKQDGPQKPVDPRATQDNVRKFEELVAASLDLREAIALLKPKALSSQDNTIDAKNEELRKQFDKLSQVSGDYTKALQVLEETLRNNVQLELEMKQLDEDLTTMRVELQQKSGDLDKVRNDKMISIELPIVRATHKSNLLFAMRYGKTYFVKDATRTDYNTSHVSVRSTASLEYFKPLMAAGWNLEDASDMADFTRLLNGYSSATHVITIGVWPDSFDAFAGTKAQLIKLGFEYELVPLDEVAEVPVGSRDGNARVQ